MIFGYFLCRECGYYRVVDEAADIDYRGVTLSFGKFRFRKLPGERIEFQTPLRDIFV